MEKYKILKNHVDFKFIRNSKFNTIGSRRKRLTIDTKSLRRAYFKYEKYNCSEACSEKMSYEIAKVLDYPCAHIELAEDENGILGVLNYDFIKENTIHRDAVFYLDKENSNREEFYTISNINKCLDELDKNLFSDFLKIMVFDALVGETDRHEENFGILEYNDGIYKLSSLYDNGCNLLRYFKDFKYAKKYYNNKNEFYKYVKRPKSLIYKEDSKSKYNLIELVMELYKRFPKEIEKEIKNLDKLTDNKIEEIVNKIPDTLLTNKHKEYIIIFVKERKKMLQNILK